MNGDFPELTEDPYTLKIPLEVHFKWKHYHIGNTTTCTAREHMGNDVEGFPNPTQPSSQSQTFSISYNHFSPPTSV